MNKNLNLNLNVHLKTGRLWAAMILAAWTAIAPQPAGAAQPAPETSPSSVPVVQSLPATKMGKRETYPFRGVVASVDATTKTVTLNGKNTHRVIAVLPETRLLRDGNAFALGDLKSGEAIGGTLRKTGDGREEALLIRIGAKGDGKTGGKSKGSRGARGDGDPAAEADAGH